LQENEKGVSKIYFQKRVSVGSLPRLIYIMWHSCHNKVPVAYLLVSYTHFALDGGVDFLKVWIGLRIPNQRESHFLARGWIFLRLLVSIHLSSGKGSRKAIW
jgi:hypothetical protein